MRAAYIDRVGPAENIQFGELATPAVGPSDVLVKTSAVCVDPVDTLIRSGQLPENLSFPFIVGRDMAGIVQAIGWVVPAFSVFDVKSEIVHGHLIPSGLVMWRMAYALMYSVAVLTASVIVFARREFK